MAPPAETPQDRTALDAGRRTAGIPGLVADPRDPSLALVSSRPANDTLCTALLLTMSHSQALLV